MRLRVGLQLPIFKNAFTWLIRTGLSRARRWTSSVQIMPWRANNNIQRCADFLERFWEPGFPAFATETDPERTFEIKYPSLGRARQRAELPVSLSQVIGS